MEITRITQNNYNAFEDLFPEDFVFHEELLAYGTVSEQNEAISAMVIKAYDDSLLIVDWLYTDPRFRGRGAATELLDTMRAFLEQMGMKTIMISFRDDDEELEDFLCNRGFAVGAYDDIYQVPIGDLIFNPKIERMMEDSGESLPAYDLNNAERMDLLKKLIREKELDEEMLAGMSEKLSVLSLNQQGEAAGCILIKEIPEGDLEVIYFLNDSEKGGVISLILGLQRVLEKNDLFDKNLIFVDPKGGTIKLIESLTDESADEFRVKGFLQGVSVL